MTDIKKKKNFKGTKGELLYTGHSWTTKFFATEYKGKNTYIKFILKELGVATKIS